MHVHALAHTHVIGAARQHAAAPACWTAADSPGRTGRAARTSASGPPDAMPHRSMHAHAALCTGPTCLWSNNGPRPAPEGPAPTGRRPQPQHTPRLTHSSPKRMKSAQWSVGALFDDFTPKRSFSCENGIQSRKWKDKIKKSILHPFRRWRLDTTEPIGPTSDVGSAHNFGRGDNTSCSCLCQSCGHFQHRRLEQWAPPCFFSVIAAHFLTLFVWKTCRFFPSTKKWNKTQPTTGQTSYTFGMRVWRRGPKQPQ